jgi:hypothetical protein
MGAVNTTFYLYKAGVLSLIAYHFFMQEAPSDLVFTLLIIDALVSIVLFTMLRRSQRAMPQPSASRC